MSLLIAGLNLHTGIEDAWAKVTTFAPKIIGFLFVLVVGMFVAKAIRKALSMGLRKAKVDNVVDKSGFGKTLRNSGVGSASDLLVKILYFGLVLLVWQIAINVLGKNPVSNAISSILAYVPKVAVAIAILFVTGIAADKIRDALAGVTGHQTWGRAATKMAVAGIWIIGAFAALNQIQIARDVVDTLFRTFMASLGAIMVIKFGVGGIWAARDRFWPRVYDGLGATEVKDK